jgi:hypothetical protein
MSPRISVFTPSVISRFNKYARRQNGNCIEWIGAKTRGYGVLTIQKKRHYAHRIAWALWNSQEIPDPGMQVCHHCDNPPCVYGPHLFLGTNSDNLADMARKGRSTRGERDAMAKLTEAEVREIRRLRSAGLRGWDVANQFNVSEATVSMILTGKRWEHVA